MGPDDTSYKYMGMSVSYFDIGGPDSAGAETSTGLCIDSKIWLLKKITMLGFFYCSFLWFLGFDTHKKCLGR